YSHPTFLDDVVQSLIEDMGTKNTISIRHADLLGPRPYEGFLDPTLDPLGSRSDYRYNVELFWGTSDHEDAGEASIGIPAILLGDFPDVFLGTQLDTPEVGDPNPNAPRGDSCGSVSLCNRLSYGGRPSCLHRQCRRQGESASCRE